MPRFRSIDVLRGAVIGVMVFVNNLGGAPGVPGWTQHLPAAVDGYTVADMVLPWFLFLAGVSLPPSLGRFAAGAPGTSPWAGAGRVLPRVAGLLLLGVVFVNRGRLDPAATGLSSDLWLVLTVAAAVLFLRRPAGGPGRAAGMVRIVAGLALVALLLVFRGKAGADGAATWLHPGWWGILGIIGWAYGVGALIYLATRGSLVGLMGALGLCTAIAIGTALGRSGWLEVFSPLFGVHDFFGSLTAIVVAGAIAGTFVTAEAPGRLRNLVVLGSGLWLAGWFLRPLHGYHKLGSTESWALVAAGQGALMLAAAHLLCDRLAPRMRASDRVVTWLGDAGRSALLAYLLSEWLHPASNLLEIDLTPAYSRGGLWAMANAAAVAVAVLAVAAFATRQRFEVKL